MAVYNTTKHSSQHNIGANVHTLPEFETSKSIYAFKIKMPKTTYKRFDWFPPVKTKNLTEGHIPACIECCKLGISKLDCNIDFQLLSVEMTLHCSIKHYLYYFC